MVLAVLVAGAGAPPASASLGGGFEIDRVAVSHVSGGEVAIDEARGLALTADRNTSGNPLRPSVTLVDTRRRVQTGSISLAHGGLVEIGGVLAPHVPSGLDADAHRGLVVTSNSAAGSVTVARVRDAAARAKDFVRVGAHPFGVAIDEVRGVAYVASYGEHRIDVIDVHARRVVDTISGVWHPTKLALDPRRGRLYVGNADRTPAARHELAVVDTRQRAVVGVVPADANSRPSVDLVTGTVYTASFATGRIAALDPRTLQTRAAVSTGTTPHGVAVDRHHGLLYAPNLLAGTVSVLRATTLEPVATLAVPGVPLGVAIDQRRGTAWISLRDAPALVAIRPR